MLGRSILGSNPFGDSRVFVYEVAGLRQTDRTDQDNHAIRKSSTVMMPVAFNRMSEFMQQMNRLGGQIISIHPLNESTPHISASDSQED